MPPSSAISRTMSPADWKFRHEADALSHRMPVVLGDVEGWLNLDTTLDDVDPLGPERFAVRAVNAAVNKVSEKNIDAIERAA